MEKIVFATNNPHKLVEVRSLLSPFFDVVSLSDMNCFDDIPETADTLKGNAFLKAQYIYDKFGVNCFADDTGLEVEALNGEPGVFSARYAGEDNNAARNMLKVLEKLGDSNDRNAHFTTVIALIINGETHYFEGKVDGRILKSPRGDAGFGYDPIFVPKGYLMSYAQLSINEKNKMSHRAHAIKKFIEYLQNIYSQPKPKAVFQKEHSIFLKS